MSFTKDKKVKVTKEMVFVVAVALTVGGSSGVWFGLAFFFFFFILLWNLTTQAGDREKKILPLVK